MHILVLNGGSSSFKCWFHDVPSPAPADPPAPMWEARVEWHDPHANIRIRRTHDGTTTEHRAEAASLTGSLPQVLESLWSGDTRVVDGPGDVHGVGHRIVHGGRKYRQATEATPEVRAEIARQAEFAPAHNRFELEAIEQVDRVIGPGARQVAVFDTAYHATIEPPAYVYPGPYDWFESMGIRRYGFHGISHSYAARRAAHLMGRPSEGLRLITCHLGNGASLTAVRDGRSIDTTMGFTPLEGLMMGTRSGSIDPGIIIYLQRHCSYSADELDDLLNRKSGLKGISGIGADMRDILGAIEAGNQRAQLAFDIYVHRVCAEAGAMLASLGGMDALVFTGGVGENCAPLRERVCRQFEFTGLRLGLDSETSHGDRDIACTDSRVRVLVIEAQEEWEIARACRELL